MSEFLGAVGILVVVLMTGILLTGTGERPIEAKIEKLFQKEQLQLKHLNNRLYLFTDCRETIPLQNLTKDYLVTYIDREELDRYSNRAIRAMIEKVGKEFITQI